MSFLTGYSPKWSRNRILFCGINLFFSWLDFRRLPFLSSTGKNSPLLRDGTSHPLPSLVFLLCNIMTRTRGDISFYTDLGWDVWGTGVWNCTSHTLLLRMVTHRVWDQARMWLNDRACPCIAFIGRPRRSHGHRSQKLALLL